MVCELNTTIVINHREEAPVTLLDSIIQFLGPHYMQVKFVHLLFAMVWLWSTAVAYLTYIVPVVRRWFADPNNPELLVLRNEALERFDDGVVLEHIAFPVVLLTGLCLLLVGGWGPDSYWLVLKLGVVCLIFLPIEVYDYWLSHFGGNKKNIRRREGGDAMASPRYEQVMQYHLWFLVVTTPLIAIGGVSVVYLATVKPM